MIYSDWSIRAAIKMNFQNLRGLVCTGLTFGLMLSGIYAESAIVTNCVPLYTYADNEVPTYDEPGGPKKGFITPRISLVYVKEIRSDGWAYGSYEIAGGKRKYRWFQMQNLQGYSNFENYSTSLYEDQIVYRSIRQNSKTGDIFENQSALVVGASGNLLKIIYKVDGKNEYKMGWIDIPVEPVEEYDENEQNQGTNGVPTYITGPVYNVYGTVNARDIDASYNDNTKIDNSVNDNSTNIVDNSINDNSVTNNTKNIDNSQHTSTTNIDNRGNSQGRISRNINIGDVNRDRKVNIHDVNDLCRYLLGETDAINKKSADINQDGNIDKADVRLLLKKLKESNTAIGDINNDGKIDDQDLNLLKNYIAGKTTTINKKEADISGYGRYNSADVTLLENLLKYLKQLNIEVKF